MARLLGSIGSTGLNRFGGRVYEEVAPQLRNPEIAIKVFSEMANNDPIVGAVLYTIESLFRQVTWRVEPASEDKAAVDNAEFLETVIEDMSHTWDSFVSEILSMTVFGWSYFEIVYKKRQGRSNNSDTRSRYTDGKVGWRKISIRPQETLDRWEFDDDGGIKGMWQSAPPNFESVFIPIEKALLFRVRSHKNNPEGRTGGLLRNAYRSWFYSKRIQEIEATGIERDLVGYPVITAPMEILDPNATGVEAVIQGELKNLIQRIRRDEDEGAIMPPKLDRNGMPTGYDLFLLSSGGKRNFDTDSVIRRYETRIAQSILAEFIMLGTENVGSFALNSSKTKLFAIALGALRDSVLSVINRFAIPRLMEINGEMDPETYPTMEAGDFEETPLDEISNYVTSLASVGAIDVGPKLERKLLELGKLPEEEEYERELEADNSTRGLTQEAGEQAGIAETQETGG